MIMQKWESIDGAITRQEKQKLFIYPNEYLTAKINLSRRAWSYCERTKLRFTFYR